MAAQTTPRSLKGAIAVSLDSDVKPLGYLTWFSVPDEQVSLRTLKMRWGVAGLPVEMLPKDTKAIHAFKRAMREQEGRKKNGVVTETTVAMVTETPDDCVYQISRLVRDFDEKIIDYPKAARVIFNKITEELHFKPLGGVPRAELLPMFDEIEASFEQGASKVTGAKVRTLVRNYLRDTPDEATNRFGLGGENMRGKAGGIYFVPSRHRDQLDALASCLDELYKGRAYLHYVPMADGAGEREIVRRHHVANAKQEMRDAIAEAKALLSGDRDRAVRSDAVKNQWARLRRLERQAADYKSILEDEEDELADMQNILRRQLQRLPDVD